jgi:hypothetical protein
MSDTPEQFDPLLNLLSQRPHPDWRWQFEPDAHSVSAINAVALCNLALLAYSPAGDMEEYLADEKRGFDRTFTPLRQADTQGFVARRPEGVFICFRGTEPMKIADWLSDVNFHRVDFCGSHGVKPSLIRGLVHGGFAAALNVVRNDLLRAVALLAPKPEERIWVTGHSLGGALAVLAAAVLKFEAGRDIAGLYTYGQPRVGDNAFCEAFGATLGGRFFRYVNDQDIVPHAVPISLPGRFESRLTGMAQNPHPSIAERLTAFVDSMKDFFEPETFSHGGELMMLARDGTLITNPQERDKAWDERETPVGLSLKQVLTKAPQLIREALNKDVLRGARLLDHDPLNGYLPKLARQTDIGAWRQCYPLRS